MSSFWPLSLFGKAADGKIDRHILRQEVQNAYSSAASTPRGKHAFPVGRWFAESVGYPADLLDDLPQSASESFAGVSNVSLFADIPKDSTVVDIGCGAGLDSLIASRKTGPGGQVIGVDFSELMIEKARSAALSAKLPVEYHCADAEHLPVESGWADVVLVNGIFNLNPFRHAIFLEIARLLHPGGSVFASELVLKKRVRDRKVRRLDDWFA